MVNYPFLNFIIPHLYFFLILVLKTSTLSHQSISTTLTILNEESKAKYYIFSGFSIRRHLTNKYIILGMLIPIYRVVVFLILCAYEFSVRYALERSASGEKK